MSLHPEIPRYPLVFMHGMGITAHALKPGNVFDNIVRDLRRHGIDAYAPRVGPYSATAVRAATWTRHFEDILRQTGKPRLNLLGFSSGGLDARYLVHRLGGHRYVASLTTLATPHRGSALPVVLQLLPRPLWNMVITGLNALSRRVYPFNEPDAAATLYELTPDYLIHHFNDEIPDHPEVAYFSMAARAGREAPTSVIPPLWPLNRIVYAYEGINDGFVSVESARWTGFQGLVEADHAQLVGIGDQITSFNARRFYRDFAQGLALKGF